MADDKQGRDKQAHDEERRQRERELEEARNRADAPTPNSTARSPWRPTSVVRRSPTP